MSSAYLPKKGRPQGPNPFLPYTDRKKIIPPPLRANSESALPLFRFGPAIRKGRHITKNQGGTGCRQSNTN